MKLFRFSLVIASLLFVSACGNSDVTSNEKPMLKSETGVTIFYADVDRGVAGSFERDGQAIFFETKRGKISEQWTAGDKEAPKFEIDVRFYDELGLNFMSKSGGDGFMIPGWGQDNVRDEQAMQLDHMHRRKSFSLAYEAVLYLPDLDLPEEMNWELSSLVNLAEAAFENEPDDMDFPHDHDHILKGHCSGYDYRHRGSIYKKSFLIFAEHSALRRYRHCESCYAQLFFSATCNHGTCADESPMAYKCGKSYYGRTNGVLGKRNCTTSYNATGLGGHVCNDDTTLQYTDIYRNNETYNAGGGTCSDWSLNGVADSCY